LEKRVQGFEGFNSKDFISAFNIISRHTYPAQGVRAYLVIKLKCLTNKKWVVYLIRCSDESLYCGITNNLKNRLIAHNSGRGAKYTRSRRPVELVGASSAMTKSDALKLEYRVKQVPADNKYYELIKDKDKMAMDLNKILKAINKDFKALAKKVDKIIGAVGKLTSL